MPKFPLTSNLGAPNLSPTPAARPARRERLVMQATEILATQCIAVHRKARQRMATKGNELHRIARHCIARQGMARHSIETKRKAKRPTHQGAFAGGLFHRAQHKESHRRELKRIAGKLNEKQSGQPRTRGFPVGFPSSAVQGTSMYGNERHVIASHRTAAHRKAPHSTAAHGSA
jgi:hypothetical protein